MARLVACALGFGFANAETAECRPGYQTLANDCGTSVRTIERCFMDLEAAGWIARKGGEGPGVSAAIVFRFPERPPEVADDEGERPPVLADERPPVLAVTPASSDAPPIPPYMDQPNMNQRTGLLRAASQVIVKGGQRPRYVTVCVPVGSVLAGRWDEWLAANAFPPLAVIGQRLDQKGADGWEMPVTLPAGFGDEVATRIATRWADWLRGKA
jgi:hypothetical protein